MFYVLIVKKKYNEIILKVLLSRSKLTYNHITIFLKTLLKDKQSGQVETALNVHVLLLNSFNSP